MKTDRVFVLLLVVLLPLSGCFDGSVGDADATDDSSENTPSASAVPEYKSLILEIDRNNTTSTEASEYTNYLTIGTFNTSQNTIVEMVYGSISGLDSETGLWGATKTGLSQVYFESNCGDFTYSTLLNEAAVSTQSIVQLDGTIGSDCSIEVNLLVYDGYTGITFNTDTEADDNYVTTTTTEFHIELAMMTLTATPM